jgi:hypothetical protein
MNERSWLLDEMIRALYVLRRPLTRSRRLNELGLAGRAALGLLERAIDACEARELGWMEKDHEARMRKAYEIQDKLDDLARKYPPPPDSN